MKPDQEKPGPTVHRWAFKQPDSVRIHNGSRTIAVRRHAAIVGGRQIVSVGDTLSAFRWHRIRPGKPVEELGKFIITFVVDVLLKKDWFEGISLKPQVALPVGPERPSRRDREAFARIWCGFPSWAALVKHAQGRRAKIPDKGIRLTVVHWKRGAA